MTIPLFKHAGVLTLFVGCMFLLAPSQGHAARGDSGADSGNSYSIGLGLGDPTGIEFGFWFDNNNWLDIGVGSGGFSSAVLYITYHWMMIEFDNRKSDVFQLGLSLGLGGLVGGGGNGYWGGRRGYWGDRRFDGNARNVRFGARLPIGLEFLFAKVPLSLFFQIGPQITNYFPDDIIAGQIGARFHFGNGRSQR